MDKTVYLSAEGRQKLQERLDNLTNVERPLAVEKLATAREHGDLSENAEYTTAKDALAKMTAEIEELERQSRARQQGQSSRRVYRYRRNLYDSRNGRSGYFR